ncbi:MAG TPA: hypothetical protein VN843_11540 [Anaerolineales bacterium]|nr:hypothetical protein [Anaerolineales bacterium]
MSLLMYRDRVLSADRRMLGHDGKDGGYSGFEYYSKLYISEDRQVLMGAVGEIPSKQMYEKFTTKLADVHKNNPNKWFEEMVDTPELTTLLSNQPTIYLFFDGKFLILRVEDDRPAAIEYDLETPKVVGMGQPAATVLLRSGQKFSLEQFYRIVSSACEGVSIVFDHPSLPAWSYLNIGHEYSAIHFFQNRLRKFNYQITMKALMSLAAMVTIPGEVDVIVPAIVHLHRPIDIENHRVITWQWLKENVFQGKFPTRDICRTFYDKQRSFGFINWPWAFELMTEEESNFWSWSKQREAIE